MKVEQDNQIKISKDYDSFKRLSGNRKLYPSHVTSLVEAFKDKPDVLSYNPILVNEKLEIIDGQHRLEAAKELNIPVYYIVHKKLGIADIQALNSGVKPWGPTDYAESYAELGKVDYQLYLEMMAKYPIGHDLIRHILSRGNCNYPMFKSGKFQIFKIFEATGLLDKLMDFKEYYSSYNTREFVFAFQKMFANESYHHEHMINELGKNPTAAIEEFDTSDYLRQLEGIYNANAKPENTVRFF